MSDRFMQPIRIGYMAGREVPLAQIAAHFNCSPALIRNALVNAGVTPPVDRGPVVFVTVPLSSVVEAIDVVGRKFRMSREQVAEAALMALLRAGPEAIEDALARGGIAGE